MTFTAKFLHTSNEEVEKALAQANKDRETLFQRCVELTAQLQAFEDKLKRAEESERQVADLRHRLIEAEKERDNVRERERDRELNAAGAGGASSVAAAAGATGGFVEGETGTQALRAEEQSGAKDEGLEVKLLQEKVPGLMLLHVVLLLVITRSFFYLLIFYWKVLIRVQVMYLKSLLARSNAQSKEQKRVVAELQARLCHYFDLYKFLRLLRCSLNRQPSSGASQSSRRSRSPSGQWMPRPVRRRRHRC